MRARAQQHIRAVDDEHAIEPIPYDAVCLPDAPDDGVHLEVRLDMVPVAFVARPGVGLEGDGRRMVLLGAVPRGHVEAVPHVHTKRFGVAVAPAHGTILRHTDEIVGWRPETEIDVLAVLQGELGPATVVMDL